ncbi:MAG TPA: ABC transporter substrate-binding protein, partial [Anaerolineae bacterium]|nr:ABC transporter substrate-binding protein [Anaerolineae bacterium]
MRKSLLALLSMLVIGSLLLTACGGGATPTPAPPEPTTPAPTAAPEPTKEPTVVSYERSETLYTTGKQWGPPSNWNPVMTWAYAMGTVSFCYETLFL